MSEKDKAFDHQVGESFHWQVPPPDYGRHRAHVGRESTVVDVFVLGKQLVQASAIAVGESLTGMTLYRRGVDMYRVNLKKQPQSPSKS